MEEEPQKIKGEPLSQNAPIIYYYYITIMRRASAKREHFLSCINGSSEIINHMNMKQLLLLLFHCQQRLIGCNIAGDHS